jgi:1-phosphofructokinase family hexose kinase
MTLAGAILGAWLLVGVVIALALGRIVDNPTDKAAACVRRRPRRAGTRRGPLRDRAHPVNRPGRGSRGGPGHARARRRARRTKLCRERSCRTLRRRLGDVVVPSLTGPTRREAERRGRHTRRVTDAFTLHVVCPNHALDRLLVVPRFQPFAVSRASRVETLAGGKGMIVCRAARRLGASVGVHGFVGGSVGERIVEECRHLGAEDRNTRVSAETRTTTVIIDGLTAGSTVINERGPSIEADDLDAMYAQLAREVRPRDVVVCTGSLPDGCPPDFHARIGRIALDRGAVPFVDAADEALRATIANLESDPAPMVLKVNLDELAAAAPTLVGDMPSMLTRIVGRTGSTIVVTQGALGATWRSHDRAVSVGSPRVGTVNATGSGDCFLAGLAVATGRGQDPRGAMVLASAMGAANAAQLAPDVDPQLVGRLATHVRVREDVGVSEAER